MIQISSKGATGSEASPLVESPWDQKMCETLPISRNGTFKNLQQLRSHFFDVFCIFHPRLILEFQAVTRVPQYVTGRHQAWDLFCAPFRSGCEAPAKRRWPRGINAADAAVLCGNPGCYKQKTLPFGNGLYHPLIGFTVLQIWNEAPTTLPVNLKWPTTSIQSIQSLLRCTKTWWKFMINSHWFQTKFMVTWTRPIASQLQPAVTWPGKTDQGGCIQLDDFC